MYDLLGQLIRVNDQTDLTAGSTGTTWLFTYDLGGNIQSKVAYAYATGTPGSAIQNNAYTYGDANWKDKLTSYNGNTIAYDQIGNPLHDGTWSYTWAKGRQLQSMSKSGESVYYTYNEDGLRVQKVTTTTGTTKYTLHGKNITHLENGSNSLHFFYDAQNKPAIVQYNGVNYAYLYNLQGDVIALVNSAGAKVVEYTYDAWGKLTSKMGSMASSLGTLSPFRYRGYVYDEETGLYYLRSRYYNSDKGRFLNADSHFNRTYNNPMHNIFAYCINSPISYVDFTGAIEVYFNVYLRPGSIFDVGHTDISIGDTTYTYGRYDTNATWGSFGMCGDGVLAKGPRELFIEEQVAKGRSVSSFQLDIENDEVEKLQKYFEDAIESGTKWIPEDLTRTDKVERYKFSDGPFKEYNLFSNNCVTVSIEALQSNIDSFPLSIYGFIPSFILEKFAVNYYLKFPYKRIVLSITEYN